MTWTVNSLHEPIRSSTNDTSEGVVPSQRVSCPTTRVVFLEHTIIHGEACDDKGALHTTLIDRDVPHTGNCRSADPPRTQNLLLFNSRDLESSEAWWSTSSVLLDRGSRIDMVCSCDITE